MLTIGDVLLDYRIVDVIGRGTMGEVFLAHDADLDRRVAIKIIRHATESMRQAALRELRAGVRLDHPNIVRVFGAGEIDGDPYVVMEYIAGTTLDDLMRQRIPRNDPEKRNLMKQLCAGLAYAHKSGVVHADIKPGNLMVTRQGVLKILDFGMAGIVTADERSSTFGTIAYMAPEQLQGGARDRRWDIFAAGAVFYELSSGRPAFTGDARDIVIHKAQRLPPESLDTLVPGLDPALVAIVDRCVEMDPTRRYSDMDDVGRDLRSLDDVTARKPN